MSQAAERRQPIPSLLDALPSATRQRLNLVEEPMISHDVVIEADDDPKWAYFPHHGTVISMTRTVEAGATVEVGIVGCEGLVGIQSVLTLAPMGSDGVVQIPGSASRADIRALRAVFDEDAVLRDLMMRSSVEFLHQVSQHVVCNRLHSVEQRLAKWLLGVHDRISSDFVALTHDFLAHMLGIRRPGVTVAVGALEMDGLIRHRRNQITIRDRAGLEARTCECYFVIRNGMSDQPKA
jgi:CRP-like cAMP-binding protein